MSNSLAIAAVTSSIRYVLDRSLQRPHPGPVGGAGVTTLHPGELSGTDLAGDAGLNVYCYLATPNHAWNLTDLPTRRADGTTVQRPLAALDLHYLITCYGSEATLETQRLLGRAVAALSATSVLGRDVVSAALELYAAHSETPFLADSDLAAELELVKLAPVTLSLEEMSKLWGVLDVAYQLSLTYLATVVLVAAEASPSRNLPVRSPAIALSTSGPIHLHAVTPEVPDPANGEHGVLVLRGSRLLAPPGGQTHVRIGPATLPVEDARATAAELRISLTDAVPAGVHGLQILHRSPAGSADPAPVRTTSASNAVHVVIRPQVTITAVSATEVTLGVRPSLRPRQRPSVLLRRLSGGAGDDQQSLTMEFPPVGPDQDAVAELTFSHGDLPDGTWLVQLQVDGTDSIPTATDQTYDQPALTLPPP
ncbi:DUF4255 domain-containing protein [Pseudactinotalea sp. Z1739]|uniref:DUF4255 domain-containing protein n=1 Tax=Pseudactinotalea sp. Z1739 TaxID=3413028 RepID=UPI003C7D2CB3